MNLKQMTAGALFFIMIAGLLMLNASGCLAGSAQEAAAAVHNANLQMSSHKGSSTAPVVITVFSDFQ